MNLDEFLHQRQADPASFVCAAPSILNTMETIEQARKFVRGDSDSRIANAQFDRISCLRQGNTDFSFKGEFECVGDQIEHDLFPHVPVNVDRFAEWRAIQPLVAARLFRSPNEIRWRDHCETRKDR